MTTQQTLRFTSDRRGFPRRRLVLMAPLLIGLPLVVLRNAAFAETARTPEVRVLVHPSNGAASVQRQFIADAFLKKATRWEGGEPIRPVDQRAERTVRRRFSELVLERSVAAVHSYWQQRIFSGRDLPPPELDSDEAVVEYVAKHPGAVGYVSGAAKIAGTREIYSR